MNKKKKMVPLSTYLYKTNKGRMRRIRAFARRHNGLTIKAVIDRGVDLLMDQIQNSK